MLDKNIYLTGTGTKNQIAKAVKKLPYDKEMKKHERGAPKSVVNREGNICITKWYDERPIHMMSSIHGELSSDTCQRWSIKGKVHITVPHPYIVNMYNFKCVR